MAGRPGARGARARARAGAGAPARGGVGPGPGPGPAGVGPSGRPAASVASVASVAATPGAGAHGGPRGAAPPGAFRSGEVWAALGLLAVASVLDLPGRVGDVWQDLRTGKRGESARHRAWERQAQARMNELLRKLHSSETVNCSCQNIGTQVRKGAPPAPPAVPLRTWRLEVRSY